MSQIFALQNQFKEKQEKFVYYIVALSVTSIGFSIYTTIDDTISILHVPLGIAVLCWGISIFSGLRFIKYSISTIYANATYLEVTSGIHPETGPSPILIKAASEGIMQAMKENGKTAEKYAKAQEYLFYSGIIAFLLWHILEMSL